MHSFFLAKWTLSPMTFDLDDVWADAIKGLNHIPVQDKRRLYRIAMVGVIGIFYLLDTTLLTLFAFAGTIDPDAPLYYGSAGLGHVALFSLLHWTGFSERLKNCHMTTWQMGYGIGVQLLGITLAPQISPFFLGLMFVIFAFGTMRIKFSEALFVWLFSSIAIALTIHLNLDSRLTLQNPTTTEYLLVSVSFSLILLRAIALGYYASALRLRIYHLSRSFQDQALHDELTGIRNRRGLHHILEEQFSLHNRKGIPCSLAMIDIDHFKRINDDFGHTVGDEILKALVRQIKRIIRDSDKLIRYGGEEFILVMSATYLHAAESLVQRIRIYISQQQWDALPDKHPITISIGLSELMPQDDINAPVERADMALYAAKQSGRNRVVIHSGKLEADTVPASNR